MGGSHNSNLCRTSFFLRGRPGNGGIASEHRGRIRPVQESPMSISRSSKHVLSRRQAMVGGLSALTVAGLGGRARAEVTLRVGSDSPLGDQHTLALVKF